MMQNSHLVLGSVVAVLIALSLGIGIYYLQPQTTSTASTTTTTVTTTTNNPASGNAPYLLTPLELYTVPTSNVSSLLLVLTNFGNTSIVLNSIVLLENSSSSPRLVTIAEFGVTAKGTLVEYGTDMNTSSANLTGVTIVPSGMTSPPTTTCGLFTQTVHNENGTTTTETESGCGLSQQPRAGGVVVLLYQNGITTSSGTTFVAVGGQQYILDLQGNFGNEYVSVTASHVAGPNSTA